jgi:hypothetical protein
MFVVADCTHSGSPETAWSNLFETLRSSVSVTAARYCDAAIFECIVRQSDLRENSEYALTASYNTNHSDPIRFRLLSRNSISPLRQPGHFGQWGRQQIAVVVNDARICTHAKI